MNRQTFPTQLDIFCGQGGVGKTTLSALYAVKQALSGKKTIVITIDPAKRLADAMGIVSQSSKIQEVSSLRDYSSQSARLDLLILNTQETFKSLLDQYIESPLLLERVLNHRFFLTLTESLSSMADYMALNKLYEIYTKGEYDCIVLDTPPASHALEFLQAPDKLINFINSNFLGWITHKERKNDSLFKKVFFKQSLKAFGLLSQVLGEKFFEDLFVFFNPLGVFFGKLETRMKAVKSIFISPAVRFNLVVAPKIKSMQAIHYFQKTLEEMGVRLDRVLINNTKDHLNFAQYNTPNIDNVSDDYFKLYIQAVKSEYEQNNQIVANCGQKNIEVLKIPAQFVSITNIPMMAQIAEKIL